MTLDRETVYVWRVALQEPVAYSEPEMAAGRSLLSVEETKRADAFIGDHHRCDFIHSHVALRTVLANCLGASPSDLEFKAEIETQGRGSRAKPALNFSKEQHAAKDFQDLRFNLSHTHGQAMIAVALGREVGIDVEWQRPMQDLDSMATTVMSKRELDHWKGLEANQREPAFYHVWTRKEAYLKAIGLGLFRTLQDVTVPVSASVLHFDKGQMAQVADAAGEGIWQVTDLETNPGYSASVCWQGEGITKIEMTELLPT